MAEDTRQPNTDASKPAEVSDESAVAESQPAPTPTADTEKSSKVEDAKARVVAAKEALSEKAAATSPPAGAPAAPKPPVKKKEEGPKPVDASGHALVKKMKAEFDGVVLEAFEFLGQLSVRVSGASIVRVCDFLRQDSTIPFNYLSDLTCVHFPVRLEGPFDVIYNLYSIPANQRVRLKVALGSDESIESVTGVWPAANWMEREVYDLFGVKFLNHPDLRRLLLPPDWEGHPLRKDYALEFVENEWTAQHLPVMSDVEREQLEQRRNYGLEFLSVPQERLMRDIFQGEKEVMPKDK
ncbi:MAG: NADH-quinone oxidoreductase subunit [Acidobacteria bacterium]|nr:NADH-quinone oxidoreductase subunit [Acidobacteriota bacterium]